MEQLSNILFWISNGLLVPVVVGLLYAFVKSILLLGNFCGSYIARSRQQKTLRALLAGLTPRNLPALREAVAAQSAGAFSGAVAELLGAPYNEAYANRTLAMYEIAADKELGTYKLLVKFGPILGLMGTLIPMGPALAGLSTGDISSMAYNMQVAFATTVIGLFAGAVGFTLLQVKQRWTNTDLAQLDFIVNLMQQDHEAAQNH